jgi:membrane fusion protein (multidrug efflux system)
MAIAFEDSRRALEQQLSNKLDVVHIVLLLFLTTLVVWSVSGEIDIYRTSHSGSVKTQGGAVTVQSEVSALIKHSSLTLGMSIKKGQPLLQLDDTSAQLAYAKLTNELSANQLQQQILIEQQQLTEQKFALLKNSLQSDIKQSQAQLSQAKKVLATQQNIQQGLLVLQQTSAVAKMDTLRQALEVVNAESDVKIHLISIDDKNLKIIRNQREQQLAVSHINSQLTALKGLQEQLNKAIARAQLEIDKYALTATATGEIVQVITLPVGNIVNIGQPLATISNGSDWLIHSQFKAVDAVGHIKKGQYARILVDGFPWRQYGALEATVSRVAKEGVNNQVDVLLELKLNPNSQIPLTFGQPVTVEIRTQTVTPAMLLLNAADRAARGHTDNN